MKTQRRLFIAGSVFIIAFAVWTLMVQNIDVQSVGVNGTDIGFASLNCRFHSLTGVNMTLYTVTDWLGLVPLFVCAMFGAIGLFELIKRKSLFKVDFDIIVSGGYYIIVILCYLIFEMYPINYRPILINGFLEASYPSSTTLLVLSVMPTSVFLSERRLKNSAFTQTIRVASTLFSVFMVTGRLISGVHWITDIAGSCLLSAGIYCVYKSVVMIKDGGTDYGIQ